MSVAGALPTRRRSSIPWGLAGMLGLLAMVESSLGRREDDFANYIVSSWGRGRVAARSEAPRAGVVCFGDSLMKLGVSPQVMEPTLGRPAYNCAVIGGSAPSTYMLVRRAIESGARPAAIVVDYDPYLLTGLPTANLREWAELAGPREAVEVAWALRDASFLGELALRKALVSYRQRPKVRENIAAALHGDPSPTPELLRAHWRNWRVNRGAQVWPATYRFGGALDPEFARGYSLPSWKPHPLNAHFLRKTCDLAASQGIPIFWLLPPVSPPLQALCDASGTAEKLDRFAARMQAACPNLVVVDARHSGFPLDAFADPLHLNGVGNHALSARLAEALAGRIPQGCEGPRCLTLAAPGPVPTPLAAEDLDGSAVAVRARALRR